MTNLKIVSLLLATAASLVSSRLVVYSPPALKDKFEFNGKSINKRTLGLDYKIDAAYANFGHIPYG